MEKDMERWLKQRDSLRKKLDKFTRKKKNAIAENAVRISGCHLTV